MTQMPPNANIPYEYQVGISNGRMAIVVPSWSRTDKLSYAVFMDMRTRELTCECKGFEFNRDCHHINGLVWFCSGPRHKKKGMQPTSLDAWKSIKDDLGPRQRRVLDTLLELGGQATNKQVAQRMGRPINEETPRMLELRKMGLVDYAKTIVDPETQRSEIVWKAV